MNTNNPVTVMSRAKFEEYISQPHSEKTVAISITSFMDDLVSQDKIRNSNCGIIGVYRAVFDDTDGDDGINRQQAKEMAEFVKKATNYNIDHIIVHCGAGQSRSAGVAAAILKWITGDDMQIFGDPKYTPNMRCFRYMLEALFFEN